MNTVNITGRITHDLDMRVTQTNKHILEFQVAIRETKDITTFIRCQAWERTADYLNDYAQKGSNLAISGSLKVDRYENKNGNTVEKTYIRVSNVEILDKRKEKADYNQDFDTSGTEYERQFGGSRAYSGEDVDIKPNDLPFY